MVEAGIDGADGHVVWRHPGEADLAILETYGAMVDVERIASIADPETLG